MKTIQRWAVAEDSPDSTGHSVIHDTLLDAEEHMDECESHGIKCRLFLVEEVVREPKGEAADGGE